MACRNGHSNIVSLLIKHRASSEQPDTSGNTPLHHASAYGWLECVQVLLKYGNVNPSADNAWKMSPVTIALQKNHISIVNELLLTQDINVNSKDDDGRTLLSLAMTSNSSDSIDLIDNLLKHNDSVEVNSVDAKGKTPLYHMVESISYIRNKKSLFGREEHELHEFKIIKMLLAAGANLNIKGKDGKSPFALAFEGGMTDLMKLFGGSIDLN